jgi:cysteinyl-tRNA synthetase
MEAAEEVLGPFERGSTEEGIAPEDAGSVEAEQAIRHYREAMDDDFNSAKALGHIFDLARAMNRWTGRRETGESRFALEADRRVLVDLAGGLGIDLTAPAEVCEIPEAIEELVKRRSDARARKGWAEADRLRQEIQDAGYLLEDREDRTIVRPIR